MNNPKVITGIFAAALGSFLLPFLAVKGADHSISGIDFVRGEDHHLNGNVNIIALISIGLTIGGLISSLKLPNNFAQISSALAIGSVLTLLVAKTTGTSDDAGGFMPLKMQIGFYVALLAGLAVPIYHIRTGALKAT